MNTNNIKDTNTDETGILNLHNDVVDAFNELDIDKLLSLHTDDVILMEPGMPAICGKQEMIKLLERLKNKASRLYLSYRIQELEVFGNRAFLRGQVIKTTVQNNNNKIIEVGNFVTLSQKQTDGKWLRTHVIVTNVEHIEPAIKNINTVISTKRSPIEIPGKAWEN
jgi:uncharacterized protein (TIGR02246 family)